MPARISKQNFCIMVIYAIVPVLVMPSIAFSTAEISVQPAIIKSQTIGEQLTVEVKIAKGKGIAGFQFILSYDTTALEYVSIKIGDYLPFDVFEVPPKVSDGTIRYAVAAPRGKLSEKEDGGRVDVAPENQFLQVAAIQMNAGKTFKPHRHIWKDGEKSVIAQESWVVIS